MAEKLRSLLSHVLWPLLLLVTLASFHGLWQSGMDPEIATFVVYFAFFGTLYGLEFALPYERVWLEDRDRQTAIDLTLTASYFVVNGVAAVIVVAGLVWLVETWQPLLSLNLWPTEWPLWVQIALGIIVTDLGNNLAHRVAHEWPLLWRFHAVHHSAPRLGVITTGRFHPVDVVESLVIGTPIPFFLGAPPEIIYWYAAINSYIGIMTHANVDLRCGIFNYIFNTPEVHRWHHSRVLEEGNTNYGEATILWDHVFRSFLHSRKRRPPVNVGTSTPVPLGLGKLLWQPLTKGGYLDGQPTLTELPADAT